MELQKASLEAIRGATGTEDGGSGKGAGSRRK
jgi:hypothetical protein